MLSSPPSPAWPDAQLSVSASAPLADMRILVVDDNPATTSLLEQLLERAGYRQIRTTDEALGVDVLCEHWRPDLMLLDLHMPERSGLEVMRGIASYMVAPPGLPVLVVTADTSRSARQEALSHGARDFITKPIDGIELLLRVRTQLLTRHLQAELLERNAYLDVAVRERTAELEATRLESLTVLASVTEYHDDETHQHTQRVGATAALIARRLGLGGDFVASIRSAAPLHDIGKIGVSRDLLLKPGRLTDAERETMRQHVALGAGMLASARSPVLRLAADIARHHHEQWSGGGYLLGLAGEAIPLAGRITAVADVFDALTHTRPYKEAWPVPDALAEISTQSGRHFDPRVVEAFMAIDLGAIETEARRPGASLDG